MTYVGWARPAEVGALLRIGPGPLSVSWANPSKGVHASGLGVAGEGGGAVRWLSERPSLPGPWFGGWAFDARRPWEGFDAERWILPEVLAWWGGDRPWLAAFGPEGTSREHLEARLDAVTELDPHVGSMPATRRPGDEAAWRALIDGALTAIRASAFDKVVCARVIDVEAPRPWNERSLLKSLEAQHPSCWTFLVRGRDGAAFLGASPETLLEASGASLRTEALAGTAARGEGAALLTSEKDLREHRAVVEGIVGALKPFVTSMEISERPALKVLANVEHLHTPISVSLREGVSALDVAHALHPTPAVAGRPRGDSMAWLGHHEGFSRGWYTGAVGAMGEGGLTLCVALRSALVRGATAQVFVGAGIVEGSTAQAEWLETERKARALLPILGVDDV